MRNTLLFLLVFSVLQLRAQNPTQSEIQWTGIKVFEVNNGFQHEDEYSLRTSSSHARLVDASERVIREFNVNQIDGSWTHVSEPGAITFHCVVGEQSALISIERRGSGITGRIFISEDIPVVYELTINGVTWND